MDLINRIVTISISASKSQPLGFDFVCVLFDVGFFLLLLLLLLFSVWFCFVFFNWALRMPVQQSNVSK